MYTNRLTLFGIVAFISVLGCGSLPVHRQQLKPGTQGIILELPEFGPVIKSPLKIKGKAPGWWMDEGSMPVILQDSKGKIISKGVVFAEGEWITGKYVEFKGTLTFDPPEDSSGTLVIERDNPSGLRIHIMYFGMAVLFRLETVDLETE